MAGQFTKARIKTEKKPSAKFKGKKLEKQIEGLFRTGIKYENLGAVKEAIEAGERQEVGKLAWGVWENYPYTILHGNQRYIRLYPPHSRDDDGNLVPKWKPGQLNVKYLVDGKETTKEDFESYLNPSDRSNGSVPDCFTVKESNLEFLS